MTYTSYIEFLHTYIAYCFGICFVGEKCACLGYANANANANASLLPCVECCIFLTRSIILCGNAHGKVQSLQVQALCMIVSGQKADVHGIYQMIQIQLQKCIVDSLTHLEVN